MICTTFVGGHNPFPPPPPRETRTLTNAKRRSRVLFALRERPWMSSNDLIDEMGDCGSSVGHSLLQVMHNVGQLDRIRIAGRWRYALAETPMPVSEMDLSDDLPLAIALMGPCKVAEIADLIGCETLVEVSNLGIRLGKLHRMGELMRTEVERKFIYEVTK